MYKRQAVNLAKEIDADLVMASDPDADRVGIACKDDKGEWVLINGNQTCMMYLYYILTQYKQLGKIKGGEFCVKTIVTTELIKKIADKNNIEMLDCYTGFKWIAREIRLREGKQKYIGGGEESYGFLAEDFVRDKDAVSACCLIAEVAAWAKDNGKSLYQLLLDIYVEYGLSLIHICTNLIVGKNASADGSTIVSYSADSYGLFGELYHYPAATYPKGTMLKVYEWDTGKYLGEIEQARQTYNVVGNMNEYQVRCV